ncbi:NADH-quinone oxidoreductase subunit L [Microbacterium sp. LRZ72]|uniref:proton-conducting transporter transmembrane domain-containing protein n=1 Tax=Microbacterium sp. LRZ72 TaxID=2942481 RepID=UPI0029B2C2AB|nr:proton-conducting transporter membrane subunit [Microbacterium sp. LRZ72]MDX2376068.1 NADH-quinone oxidoreductase subunit L [Microbacterium sp. LRZ72]
MTSAGALPPAGLLLWALVAVPAVAGVLLLVLRPPQRVATAASIGAAGVVVILAVAAALTRPAASAPFLARIDLALRVDALAAAFLPAIAAVTLLVLVFTIGSRMPAPARFHGLMLLFAAAALVTAVAANLVTLLFAWEVMGAASYALIGFRWWERRRVSSGLTAFLATRTADLGLYAAAGLAVAAGTGMAFADLAEAPPGWRDAIAAGIALAALGKAAQLPFSFWLSRAMDGPSPVSALLHSAAMVALGAFLLLRIVPLLEVTPAVAWTVACIGMATAVALGVVALAQDDLKQLLAASTASQLGFAVCAAGLAATAAGTTHLLAHAATKAALFLAAGAWLGALGTKRFAGLAGAAARWPVIGWSFTAAALTLAGVPPLALWWTKDAVLATALQSSPALYTAGLVAVALTTAYAVRALALIRRPRGEAAERLRDEEEPGSGRVRPAQRVAVLTLAVAAVALIAPATPALMRPLAEAVGGVLAEPGPAGMLATAVLAIAVGAAVAVAVRRDRLPTPAWAASWSRSWLGLERAAHAGLIRPVLASATLLARFDDRVIDRVPDLVAAGGRRLGTATARTDDVVADGAVRQTSRGVGGLARLTRTVDDRGVDGTVDGFARGVRAVGHRSRRAQTGLLHQYYLQAVVALAAAVVIVLLLLTLG